MAADRPEVVPLEEVPPSEILALLETCLGPGGVARNEAFWRWKHERNPFGRSMGLVAVAGGRPVALRVFLRWRWLAEGRAIEAVRAVDTATHPDWRRRGLFRRLTSELVARVRSQRVAFVFNTPNRKSRAGYLAMGWEDAGRVPLLVRVRRPARVLGALLRAARPDRETSTWPPDGLRTIGELLEEPALAALLTEGVEWEPRLHTPRTPEYLRWRYQEVPGPAYGALWHLEGASGAVAVVRSRRRRGLREISFSELLLSDDSVGREVGRWLIERLATLPGVDHIAAAAVPESAERELLRRSGWLPVPLAPRWIVRPLRTVSPDPQRGESWRLSVGDLELF